MATKKKAVIKNVKYTIMYSTDTMAYPDTFAGYRGDAVMCNTPEEAWSVVKEIVKEDPDHYADHMFHIATVNMLPVRVSITKDVKLVPFKGE